MQSARTEYDRVNAEFRAAEEQMEVFGTKTRKTWEDLSLQEAAREHELQRRIDVLSRRLQSNLPPGGPQQSTVAADTASIPNLALLA